MSSVPHVTLDRPAPERALALRGAAALWSLIVVVVLATAGLAAAGMLVVTIGPRFLPYEAVAVEGGSMSPAIPLGSEVFLRPVRADRLRVGDVITFSHPGSPGGLVTHRIVRIEQGPRGLVFVTKGDANSEPDAWRVDARGTGWRYAFHVPRVGYVVEVARTPLARFALLALVAVVLGGTALRRVWAPT